MGHIFLIIFCAMLLGCESTARPTLCSMKSETYYTLNTKQHCRSSDEVMAVMDLAITTSFQALFYLRYIDSYEEAVEKFKDSNPLVCIVKDPEPCCLGSWCASPYHSNGEAARKAGCATQYFAWAAKYWPPICTPEWPDEPHCTKDKSIVSTSGWQERLRHEIFNTAVLNCTDIYDATYKNKIYQEAEPRAQQAFSATQNIMK